MIVLSQVQSNGFIMDDSQTILMTGLEKNFDSVYRPSPSRVIMTDPLKGFGLLSNLTTAAPEGSGATTGTRTTTRILLDISIYLSSKCYVQNQKLDTFRLDIGDWFGDVRTLFSLQHSNHRLKVPKLLRS